MRICRSATLRHPRRSEILCICDRHRMKRCPPTSYRAACTSRRHLSRGPIACKGFPGTRSDPIFPSVIENPSKVTRSPEIFRAQRAGTCRCGDESGSPSAVRFSGWDRRDVSPARDRGGLRDGAARYFSAPVAASGEGAARQAGIPRKGPGHLADWSWAQVADECARSPAAWPSRASGAATAWR